MSTHRDQPAARVRHSGLLPCAILLAFAATRCERSSTDVCRAHADCRVCQRCVNGACSDDLGLPNCSPPRCEGCLAPGQGCGEACRAAGYAGGYCSNVGSTDPAACCACDDNICDVPPGGVQGRGVALARGGAYDYGPSMMLDRGHSLRLWWCGQGGTGLDAVFHARSNDWATWSEPVEVLNGAGPPYQGQVAGSPAVVRTEDGQYLMFFTSEDAARTPDLHYQIFLARSADGIAWEHASERRPVIPLLDPGDDLDQPSAVILAGRILVFHSRKFGENKEVLAAESSDLGASFSLCNDGQPVLDGVGACDFVHLPRPQRFLAVCQAGRALEKLRFYLLARDLGLIAELEPAADRWLQPCNHSPGLLGDPAGVALDESIVPVFFGAGTRAGNSCWNPGGWDIHAADLYTGALLNPDCR